MPPHSPDLICVAPHLVDAIWPHVVRLIDSALIASESDLTPEHIRAKIDEGKSLLWIIWNDSPRTIEHDGRKATRKSDKGELLAAGTTELVKLENGRRLCVISACGGKEMKTWRRFLSDIEHYAKQESCEAVRFYGRAGWARYFRDQGYVQPWIVVEKKI